MRRLLSVTGRFLSLTIKFVLITVVIHYLIFGSAKKDLGNMLWPEDAAPWETVDAYYYPDDSDPSRFETATGLENKEQCRDWAYAAAARNRDPDLAQGDYECGIGKVNEFESITIYRIVAQ